MEIQLQNLAGKTYRQTFSESATVSDVILYLSQQMKSSVNKIFIISTEMDHLFYPNNYYLQNINEQNLVFINIDDNNQNDENSEKKLIVPSKQALNSFYYFPKPNKSRFVEKIIHSIYTSVLKNIPDDFDDKVNEVHQLGYDIEDCKEALRSNNYNVNKAINYLVSINSNSFYHITRRRMWQPKNKNKEKNSQRNPSNIIIIPDHNQNSEESDDSTKENHTQKEGITGNAIISDKVPRPPTPLLQRAKPNYTSPRNRKVPLTQPRASSQKGKKK